MSIPEIAGMPPSMSRSSSETPGPRWRLDEAGDDQAAGVDPCGLELGARDPIAPGHRVRQDDHLAGIGGVGQDLAPARRGGREDEIAVGGSRLP